MTDRCAPKIIFDHKDYFILNKPAGWYSIPSRSPTPGELNLTSWIKSEMKQEPWIVHRLDRFTSGVILFAKSREAHREGNRWFAEKIAKKTYHFFASACAGSALPGRPAVQLKTPIDGKPSQTLFEVIQTKPHFFYGKATPLTGRFHQIREHAQQGHFPLLGDARYGFDASVAGTDFHRVALHAYELTLPLGTFHAELPKDMRDKLNEE